MKSNKRVHPLLVLLVLVLASGLRFYLLGAQSLWNDEGTSVAVAQRDLASIARDAAQDIHPPLYYWLLSGWVRLVGTGEAGVRSLSALLGVGLVALTYALGRSLAGRTIALAAAILAAVNPFQVYYAQEARMYTLLAVVSAAAVLALVVYVQKGGWLPLVAVAALEAAGLYTHYSFAFVALALNGAFALSLRRATAKGAIPWCVAQAAAALAYAPWLPVAWHQVGSWPAPEQTMALLPALARTGRWLVLGPTASGPLLIPALLAAAMAAGVGLLCLAARERRWAASLLALWLGLPVALVFALGLFREAYLKFLLVTAPALSLLLAAGLTPAVRGPWGSGRRGARAAGAAAQGLAAILIALATAGSLHSYFADPDLARDDYRGIAAYVQAVGTARDAVVLNAPGQQEVFGYYYCGEAPVYPLPRSRPPDPAATQAELARLVRPGGRVFAVLWATDESDPERLVEGWLDSHTYKALDSWYGSVRLAVYAVPTQVSSLPASRLDVRLAGGPAGDEITLLGYSLAPDPLAAGDIAQVALFWRADQTPERRYKVFVHLLDEANHIVGQRDTEPGGGARLTTLWAPGETVVDLHGVPVHPATPPGRYRVEVGLYDAETGQRLATSEGANQVWLDPVTVGRPPAPAPLAALGMQHAPGQAFGALSLLGYDAFKLGFDHAPDEPLHPGDLLHVNLYWRAEAQPAGDWRIAVDLVDEQGLRWAGIEGGPAGDYPTRLWLAGDIWRGQFDLPIPGDAAPGQARLRVQPLLPSGEGVAPFLSAALRIVGR